MVCLVAALALLLNACVQLPGRQAEPSPPRPDPMADVAGDRPLPPAQGALERIDCLTGDPDMHARIAFEARGGQIAGFAFYSKWKPYTCSIDLQHVDPNGKWRLTADGATRVQTPHGSFVIRSNPDRYVFEFRAVQRMEYCGMFGESNGTMTIMRNTPEPQCSADGIMDR